MNKIKEMGVWVEFEQIPLYVTGTFYPEIKAGWNEPKEPAEFHIGKIEIDGFDIYGILTEEKHSEIAEETINTIQS